MNHDVSDEMLMALADGELGAEESLVLSRQIAADADLSRRYAVFEDTRAALRGTRRLSEQEDRQEVPERLIRAILTEPATAGDGADAVGPFSHSRQTGSRFGIRPRWRDRTGRTVPLALAASVLVVAVAAGFLAGRALSPVPGLDGSGDRVALPTVGSLLADVPTGGSVGLPGDGEARALASFETDIGLCRLVAVSGHGSSTRAILCRHDDDWSVTVTVADGGGDQFSAASTAGVGVVDHYLDAIGAGAPLDPETEAARLGENPERP